MAESARPATTDDVDAILAVAARIAGEMAEGRGGPLFLAREAATSDPRARIEALIDDERATVVVGCYDDVVFGYAAATIEELGDGTTLGRLDDLAVEPEAREVGIGEAMMDDVLDHLRAAGCVGVDSRALPGDRSTKNFFESFGLKARLLVVNLRFDD